ncbi:hypothetical protein BH10PAT1_BH10PAT1_0190 [soil metagenome]
MAEFDRLLDLLSLGNPIQDQYQALHDQEEAELEPTDVEIINLLVEFNERSLDIRSRRQLITDKYELAEEPIKESLKGLEDETRSALQEMITDLQIENEVLEIEITPLDLVEAVKKLPEAEPTTKFIIDLLTLTSVDKNENISPTSLSFDMTDKTTGGLNISSNIGGGYY